MVSKQFIDTEPSPFKTCMYLILIILSISDDTRLSRGTQKRWRSHIHSACEMFASRSRSIRIICSFVTLLLKLSNHTKAPWRINTAFCHVTLPYTRTARASVRENCLRFRRDVSVSLLLAIYFFSNDCEKLLDRTKCQLLVHTSCECINYRITERRLLPASNKS